MLKMNAGDKVFPRLHHGYRLPGEPNKKFGNQRCGPFTIKRRVGHLAYELADLPDHWRIHPVISIAQLEPAPKDVDPYGRPRPVHPPAVEVEGDDDDEWKAFAFERLVSRRVTKVGKKPILQYLVRWLGYGPAYDRWYDLELLDNAIEAVQEYDDKHRLDPLSKRLRQKNTSEAVKVSTQSADTPPSQNNDQSRRNTRTRSATRSTISPPSATAEPATRAPQPTTLSLDRHAEGTGESNPSRRGTRLKRPTAKAAAASA